ncbi:GNAT family N-acetyltransferase [Hydrogenobacter sp. T-2]|uniref:GNAT family N-acetyltransferase n=1 Tax=Pampinifervens diazotrophicum TaxID=1632018 RepID=UPI002B25DE67|nr:GNAT family N-acetyltransferase [Hydrogenobacter sp. T-2]WPM32541.1 GNAT family N-acetyltransferase [Hydrogenobacter sp. T-2]
MTIRRAEEKDIKILVDLYLLGYKGLEEYSYTHPDDVQAYLNWLFRRDVAGIWLAEEDSKVVGFVASDGNWFSKREGKVVGAIHELVVLPEYRNRGIGRALVQKALEYFKSRGLDMAELWVGDENKQAIDFYKNLGFEERDRFNYWVRMTKALE